jgi:proteasome lid subunit RPN8/RPN11
MVGAEPVAEFRTCALAGSPLTIEYSKSALEEILRAVLDGFLAFPYGGVEVGGVLFGQREGDCVRILAARPVECEHAFGPGYTLSENDESGLSQLLEGFSADGALSGLIPVGWYHSHTRSALSLTGTDLNLHNRHFPEPWQIAMLLQTRDLNSTRIGFFVRDPGGTMPEAASCEFEAGPVPMVKPPPPRDEVELQAEPVPEEQAEAVAKKVPPPPEPAPAAEVSPVPQLAVPAGRGRRSWVWPVVAACLVLAGAALVVPSYWRRTPSPPSLSLRLVEKNGRLEIQWDPTTPTIRQANRGWLEIADGPVQVVFPMDSNLLGAGSWPVARQSPEVRVRLKVQRAGAAPVEESAQFLGPPTTGEAASRAAEASPAKGAVQEEVVKLRAELEDQLAESARLEGRLKSLEERGKQVAAAPGTPKQLPVQGPPRRVFTAPPTRSLPGADVPGPPELAQQPTLTAPMLPQAGRLPGAQPAPPPPAASAAAPESPKPAPGRGPTSGKLIWTGLLPRNSVLTIENRRPSSGHLTGEWPGVPFRIGARPAEFVAGGLTVYSSNPGLARGPVTEPPGPQNGWNRTTYRYDVRLSQEVVVVEAPGAHNGWNRVLLRSGDRPLSVILLEWEVVP